MDGFFQNNFANFVSPNPNSGPRGSYGVRAPCSRSTPDLQQQQKKKKRGSRGSRKGRKRRAGARKDQLKTERLSKSNLRVLYWNCGSLNVRAATAEKLSCSADIICLQETQKHSIKPIGFASPICNNQGHGQIILIRKEIKHKEIDVTKWSSENLHLVGIELQDQPIRYVINVYACNRSMKMDDWLVLDNMQSTLPGELIFCGDFNARGSLWGNTVTNPQGEALEDALDRCSLTCINDGSITREASRPGDSDSVIDLTLATLGVAIRCNWQTLGKFSNDHYPCMASKSTQAFKEEESVCLPQRR